ncbi:MAG: hypothetical protein GY854_33260 [Deltaproteobacteria bacterium]|nr:hypothetical protein [Deltaproteobacteria bacterium]
MTFWDEAPPKCTQLTVSEDVLCELGRVVAYQSLVESALAHFISSLLKLEHAEGQIVTAEISSRQLRSTLSSLLLQRLMEQPETDERARQLLKRIAKFEERRNALIHSLYWHGEGFSTDQATRFKLTAKEGKGLKIQHESINVKDLQRLAIEAGRCHTELVLLEIDICGLPVPHIDMTADGKDEAGEKSEARLHTHGASAPNQATGADS